MAEPRVPERPEVLGYLHERRNWGRWGRDDQLGALNLITPEKRVAAARLVRTGRSLSLSREFPTMPSPGNPQPAQHWMRIVPRGRGGFAADFYGVFYHGWASTHVDALCHTWDEAGMWNGRDPAREITFDGATFGAVHHWKEGILTRGVLLDVPRHRGEPYVRQEHPVHGWELEEIAKAHDLRLEPGDAVCVYSGREAWQAAHPDHPYGPEPRPGLHASCLPFLRDHDVAVLAWDMMDLTPNGYDLPWSVHGAIFAYGVALIDNALLEPLAETCAAERRYEFLLVLAPLRVVGGTGSPANPLAVF
ncbi:MAG TPA: cyclase family protein [Methylomirabilota bacterium]|nr:cyclase family protein [Methylomirabilota bacterium]